MMEADKSIDENILLQKIANIEIRVKELNIEDLRKTGIDNDGGSPKGPIKVEDIKDKFNDDDLNF